MVEYEFSILYILGMFLCYLSWYFALQCKQRLGLLLLKFPISEVWGILLTFSIWFGLVWFLHICNLNCLGKVMMTDFRHWIDTKINVKLSMRQKLQFLCHSKGKSLLKTH